MSILDIKNVFITILGYELSYIELIGTLTGFICVYLAAKSKILTWPIGIVNAFCFFCIFYQIHLYSDMFLQVYFFLSSIYGWLVWKNNTTNNDKVSTLSFLERRDIILLIVFSTIVLGTFIQDIHILLPIIFTTPASYPYLDTFIAVSSIVATILLIKRKVESWVLWVTIDIISIVIYMKKSVLLVSFEYFIFLIIASIGLINWVKLSKQK